MIGGRGGEFAAGEAVSPGGMSSAEWNAVPGAQGGAAPVGATWDWRKGMMAGAGSMPMSAEATPMMPTSNPQVPTQAVGLNFDIVSQFLQTLLQQAGGAKKGGR